jgi:flavin-dependent dehydrogenase
VTGAYDVVVVGSGSAGATAAIAAGRTGARTLLVERMGFLGGISTAVLDTFYAFYTPGHAPRRVVGGVGWEVVERLVAEGAAFERPNTYGAGTGITYDPEVLKRTWETLVPDAGVEVLLHTWVTGVELDEDDRLRALTLFNKGGAGRVEAAAVVDGWPPPSTARLPWKRTWRTPYLPEPVV